MSWPFLLWPRRRRDERGPWGEGLDCSPQVLRYGARWDTIGDDEAVFLIPSLVAQRPPDGFGPVALLRRALAARIQWASLHIGSTFGARAPEQATFDALVDGSGLENMRAAEFGVAAANAYRALYGPALLPRKRPRDGGADRDTELAILGCLDRALGAAAKRQMAKAGAAVSLDEAILVSVHSGMNAAYVWESFAPRHETLTVAAWLGHLTRGRPAYLMTSIAEPLDELIRSRGSDAALIRHYVQCSISDADLRKAARRVIATGRPRLIQPLETPARAAALPPVEPLRERAKAWPDAQAALGGLRG
jgi:hypothetical protein